MESDVYHFLDLDQDLFKSHLPVTFPPTSAEEEKPLTDKFSERKVIQVENSQTLNNRIRDNIFLLKKLKPRRKRFCRFFAICVIP